MSISENFVDRIYSTIQNQGYNPIRTVFRCQRRTLAEVLVPKSIDLQHLSVSYKVDAQEFFNACQPSYTWHRLHSLTLTSSMLTPCASQKDISALLVTAGSVASKMPRLERMVLWNGKHEEACAVIYHKNKTALQALLTWRGTWDFEFGDDVVESWQRIVSDPRDLRIEHERVQGAINSDGDAIHLLRLADGVIDPRPLQQIRQEGRTQRMS